MQRWLAQIRIPHFLFRTILLVTIVSLVLLCSPEIEAQLSSWIPVQSRIERLQERTAEELRRYYEGEGNDNNGAAASTAWVSLMDFNGTLAWRESVAAITDLGSLSSFGLTATGYMEPESLKIKNGTMYLGFASKSSDDIRRVAILQYPLIEEN